MEYWQKRHDYGKTLAVHVGKSFRILVDFFEWVLLLLLVVFQYSSKAKTVKVLSRLNVLGSATVFSHM